MEQEHKRRPRYKGTHPGSLTTNQTEHDLKLAPRSEYPPDTRRSTAPM